MPNTTKAALEESLKRLLLKKPLDKITITDITTDWLPDFVQDCWRFIFWLFLPYVRESTGKRISRL